MFEEDRTQATCPYCGNTFSYGQSDIHQDGTASCRGCGSIIETRRRPIASQDPVFSSQSGPTSDPFFEGKKSSGGSSCGGAACTIACILLFLPLIIAIPLALCAGLYFMSKNRN